MYCVFTSENVYLIRMQEESVGERVLMGISEEIWHTHSVIHQRRETGMPKCDEEHLTKQINTQRKCRGWKKGCV